MGCTVFSPTVFGLTITLLTSLPVRGSARTTDVIRLVSRSGSAACSNPAMASIEQNRIKMFRNLRYEHSSPRGGGPILNGIILL